jgi:hypothetical protein
MNFILSNWALLWALIVTTLFLILSELLAFKPAWGASGVVRLIYNLLQVEAKKSLPEIEKVIENGRIQPQNPDVAPLVPPSLRP